MEQYDYRSVMTNDIVEYLKENCTNVYALDEEDLYDDLFVSDVTGNASGSYFYNYWRAEEAVCHNTDLLQSAIEEFGGYEGDYKNAIESAETADVYIRCYLLSQVLPDAIKEYKESVEED